MRRILKLLTPILFVIATAISVWTILLSPIYRTADTTSPVASIAQQGERCTPNSTQAACQ